MNFHASNNKQRTTNNKAPAGLACNDNDNETCCEQDHSTALRCTPYSSHCIANSEKTKKSKRTRIPIPILNRIACRECRTRRTCRTWILPHRNPTSKSGRRKETAASRGATALRCTNPGIASLAGIHSRPHSCASLMSSRRVNERLLSLPKSLSPSKPSQVLAHSCS